MYIHSHIIRPMSFAAALRKSLYMALLLLCGCAHKDDVTRPTLAITGFMPSSGMPHTLVTIQGNGFDRDSANDVVTFNNIRASIFQATDTTLIVQVPESGSSGPLEVSVAGLKLNIGTFTYQPLSIHSASPLNGPEGTNIRISGTGFTSLTRPATVTVNNIPAVITSANDTLLIAAAPRNGSTGAIQVQVNGQTATGPVFLFQQINSIKPSSGGGGTIDTIYGKGFGKSAGNLSVAFNGVPAIISTISDTVIIAAVPSSVSTGPVSITMNGQKTVGGVFTVIPRPTVTTMVPASGLPGAQVTITGKNFNSSVANDKVDFNGVPAVISSATATKLVVTVPQSARSGFVNLWVNGQTGQGPSFAVQQLNITAIAPDNGLAGTAVTITGNGFSTTLTDNKIYFNGLAATVTNATANQLTVTVPAGISTGAVSVQVNGATASGPVFRRAGVSTVYTFTGTVGGIRCMTADANGNLYIASYNGNNIQHIAPDGTTTLYAGSATNQPGSKDGDASVALFNDIASLTIDPQGNLYVADMGNLNIRKITPAGMVSTYARGLQAISGMMVIQGVLYTAADNGLMIGNGIYKVVQGSLVQVLGTRTPCMTADAAGNIFYVNGGNDSRTAVLELPAGGGYASFASGFTNIGQIATDPYNGNVLVAEANTNAIVSASADGTRTTLIQQGNTSVDGTLAQARFTEIISMAISSQGIIYVLDGKKIRKIELQ